MTALQESKLRNYANSNIPESLNYPHDAVGNDSHSLGAFQQQDYWWGTVADLMNVDYTVAAFFDGANSVKGITHGLTDINGWESMAPGDAAQRVQGSAYPDAYAKWEPAANVLIGELL